MSLSGLRAVNIYQPVKKHFDNSTVYCCILAECQLCSWDHLLRQISGLLAILAGLTTYEMGTHVS